MDHRAFDRLTRALGARVRRRGVVAGLLGLTVGALGGDRDASATTRRQTCRAIGLGCTRNSQCCSQNCLQGSSVPRNHRNRCGCPAGQTRCGATCHDLATDEAHCGACGNPCDADHTCGMSGGTTQCLGPCEVPSRYPTTVVQCVATVEGPEAFGNFVPTSTLCATTGDCRVDPGDVDVVCGTAMGMVMVDPNGNWTVVTPVGEPVCYEPRTR